MASRIAKKLWPGGMRGDPLSVEISTEFGQTYLVTPCSPEGGRRILPRTPAHSAGPTLFEPFRLHFYLPKSHPEFHSIFEGIWTPKMVPKASQNDAKIHKKCMFFPGVFSYRFFINFGTFFDRFSRRPTLDFTAIYNTFGGCGVFRKV